MMRRHPGHTLFEILLALGLSLVLLVAVYAALDLHARYSVAGRDAMERLQLTRALFEKLQLDIRSVAGRYAETETFAGGGRTGAPPAPPDAPQRIRQFGLSGDAKRIELQVDLTSRDRPWTSDNAAESAPEEDRQLQLVSWFVVDSPGRRWPPGPAAEDPFPQVAERRPLGGLVRLQTAITGETTDDSAERAAADGHLRPLAEEVRSIGFRYFDGVAWHEAWDSLAMDGLPRAVEVTLRFHTGDTLGIDADTGQSRATYRVVIAVRLAEPASPGRPP